MDESKAAIRQAMRRQRRALAPATVDAAGAAATAFVLALPELQAAPLLIAYVATDHEVPTAGLIAAALAAGKRVFLPRCAGPKMEFAEHRLGGALRPGAFGIAEPEGPVLAADAFGSACAVVPVVAWDRSGWRIGRGGGHYDRTFAGPQRPACLVGLAHAFQQVDRVPYDPWDVRLDRVITERGVVDCRIGEPGSPFPKEGARDNGSDECDPDTGARRGARGGHRLVAPATD